MRVLIVRIGAMGDVLHALPAVAALRAAMPGCQIGWAVEPRWRPLLETRGPGRDAARGPERPIVDRVHAVATKTWKRQPLALSTAQDILALRQEMRAERYDLCVDLQGSIRSAVVGKMAGTERFAGPAAPRERQARWLYSEKLPATAAHVVEQACELLGAAAGERLTPASASLPCDPAAEAWTEKVLISRGIDPGDPCVVMAPRAGWGAKVWPAERYNEVAIELRAARVRVLINAAGEGDTIARQVARDGAGTVVTCNVAQMIALTRRADLVIGGDTGPVHVAAALRRPVLALFGPTDPARTGPYGTRCTVLRDGSSVVDHRRHTETEAGLLRITVEQVTQAAFAMLRERTDG